MADTRSDMLNNMKITNVVDHHRLMEEDSPRFCSQKEEDEYYIKQIQKLLNNKIQLFADRYRLSQQLQHVHKTKVTLKPPNSSEDEDQNNKKKKIQKQIIHPPVVNNVVTDQLLQHIHKTKVTLKRPNSSEDEDQNKKKKKIQKQIIRPPVVNNVVTDQLLQHVHKTKVTLKRPNSSEDEDQNKKKKKIQKQIIRPPVVNNAVTDQMKEFITQQLNGTDLKLVIQKVLYVSDLKESQNRLNMPINQLETLDFLTAKERQDLEKGKEFKVGLLGPTLKVYKELMVLKMWHLKSTNNYVLKTNWNNFVKENKKELKEKTKIQVWSYRKEEKLCLALACM